MSQAILIAGLFFAFGGLAGHLHFALLAGAVRALADQGRGARGASLRLLLTPGAFALAATQGAVAMTAMLAGFVAVRTIVLYRAQGAAP